MWKLRVESGGFIPIFVPSSPTLDEDDCADETLRDRLPVTTFGHRGLRLSGCAGINLLYRLGCRLLSVIHSDWHRASTSRNLARAHAALDLSQKACAALRKRRIRFRSESRRRCSTCRRDAVPTLLLCIRAVGRRRRNFQIFRRVRDSTLPTHRSCSVSESIRVEHYF